MLCMFWMCLNDAGWCFSYSVHLISKYVSAGREGNYIAFFYCAFHSVRHFKRLTSIPLNVYIYIFFFLLYFWSDVSEYSTHTFCFFSVYRSLGYTETRLSKRVVSSTHSEHTRMASSNPLVKIASKRTGATFLYIFLKFIFGYLAFKFGYAVVLKGKV